MTTLELLKIVNKAQEIREKSWDNRKAEYKLTIRKAVEKAAKLFPK